ncbi:hypothetical protein JCM33374_g3978 [Metschnikowia sp. JCM 33374]|nr:hypothetical protein JCM33374_g3978 [Metschnikowia sp. JCM 33374]
MSRLTTLRCNQKFESLTFSLLTESRQEEIIVQPANALKEMLENSIDANASTIDVMAKDGGLKLLQITDNGGGIDRQDLELLCERFATSKLRSFDDLSSISTYGFRGRPWHPYLTSHIFSFSPKPVAGKDGTQITVEDLFYNSKSRLKALKSKNEEWSKILDVVGKYAVHTEGVGITCKKFGESLPAVSTRPSAPLKERIRTVFGTSVASDLIEFDFPGTDYGLLKFKGAVSGFNYNNKRRAPPVFFINNRLVACDPLRRAVSSVFSVFLPKGNHPFVYMSLDILPQNLDVNVHPTKREVRFLHEDEIIEWISAQLHDVLFARQGSRTFKQSTLKRQPDGIAMDEVTNANKKYRQENKLVRVDVTQSKINQFVKKDFSSALKAAAISDSDTTFDEDRPTSQTVIDICDDASNILDTQNNIGNSQCNKPRNDIQLNSIIELREELSQSIHRPLTNIFNNLVNVGIVDGNKRLSCFQYDVKLFLCDYGAVLSEFFYQVALSDFANYGEFVLETPLELRAILEPLYETHPNLVDIDTVIAKILEMKEMFYEYFQLELTGTKLSKLPMLLRDVNPSSKKIPFFIYRLGTKVDYQSEKQCLADIMRQIALLYVPDRIPPGNSDEENSLALIEEGKIGSKLEHVIYPELRRRFIAPEKLLDQVVQVADLPGLYKVFERC